MTLLGTLLVVSDLSQSRRFYTTLFDMEVTADFGANITLSHRLFLQTKESWQQLIQGSESLITLPHHASELYFETEDLTAFLTRMDTSPEHIPLVHPPREHPWGQRVVRIYDPDGHIIEVGEAIACVARRFSAQGMSATQVAQRMDVPLSVAAAWLRT